MKTQDPAASTLKFVRKSQQNSLEAHSIFCAIQAFVAADNRMDESSAAMHQLAEVGKRKLEKTFGGAVCR